jgi:hypothetical protein
MLQWIMQISRQDVIVLGRRLFSGISPLTYQISVYKDALRQAASDMAGKSQWAREKDLTPLRFW